LIGRRFRFLAQVRSMQASLEVRHNEPLRRFEADVEGGVAHCDYERRGDVLYVNNTEVPVESEGRGIAAAVVAALMEYARQNGLRVAPRCSYVRNYMRRHGETQALLPAGVVL
jgi:predicted GNAT family acetyltransferase